MLYFVGTRKVYLATLNYLGVQNKLWGITTAPSTLITTSMLPCGNDGTTMASATWPQCVSVRVSSYKTRNL